MDTGELKSRIKEGRIGGGYIFGGEEEYLVRYYLSELLSAGDKESPFAVFNEQIFDGEEVDFGAISEAIKAPPVMAEYKFIVWKHADFASMKERELDRLEELGALLSEHPYAVLAFTASPDGIDFGSGKKPSKFISRFGKIYNILRFDKSTENQLYSWLKRHFDAHGITVTLDTVKALVFRSGRSMDVLAGEVEKLSALAKARGNDTVTESDVAEVASSTPECDTFALSNAILDRNLAGAYFALEDMKLRRVDPTVVMGMICRTLDDLCAVAQLESEGLGVGAIQSTLGMNEYKLKIYLSAATRYGAKKLSEMLSILAEADAGSKYGGVTGYTAIELFLSRNL